jgi:hypothetical protein
MSNIFRDNNDEYIVSMYIYSDFEEEEEIEYIGTDEGSTSSSSVLDDFSDVETVTQEEVTMPPPQQPSHTQQLDTEQQIRIRSVENTLNTINMFISEINRERFINNEEDTDEDNDEDNTNIENTQSSVTDTPNEDNSWSCCVCYKELKNDANHIKSLCNHDYCRNCFFRWIELKTNCALCRRSFCTHTNLSQTELAKETLDVYKEYAHVLRCYLQTQQDVFKYANEIKEMKFHHTMLLKSQISLKDMVNYTKGYLDGYFNEYNNKFNREINILRGYLKDNIGNVDPFKTSFKRGYALGEMEAKLNIEENETNKTIDDYENKKREVHQLYNLKKTLSYFEALKKREEDEDDGKFEANDTNLLDSKDSIFDISHKNVRKKSKKKK